MKDMFLKATMGLGLLVLAADQVAAQNRNCAPRDVVLERLSNAYGETRQSIGLGANNAVVEVFASETGSWTIIVTFPDGPTCLVASGLAYETLAEALPVKGEDA
ncbi:hypothetical protein SAMN05444000_10497 [Shimia gijangensis]|uniref:Peptidase propeptide and YPEB domain-containing protein n=1 Tax=Shimia gijangensis TaxID=1470563 RepID=A0A1M6FK68_9RHOB|nr:hypothetical protein [Shimia gijangensis]SHI98087.1 hypothetical protein SAMN05444000_10497 [Shimia gijangensis]